jgi:hypothetical protein
MLIPINEYRPSTFNKDILAELKSYFDIDFVQANVSDYRQWFENLYVVAKHDVGIAHCINQHQSSRNSLNIANKLNYAYHERLGSFSVYHDIDTVKIDNHTISGIKHWITSVHQADYVVCKIGHHNNPDRCLLFIDLDQIDHTLENNKFDPIGLKVAKPMSLILKTQSFPSEWVLHQGAFKSQDPQNSLLSFLKYGFLTNFLGCAVGLFQSILKIAVEKHYHLDYQLKSIESRLVLLKNSWRDNFDLAILDTLDKEYWTWHDAQYIQTKQCLVDMLKLIIEIGNSRFYDSNDKFSQHFRDAVIWASHGKSHYEQVLLSQYANIN